MYSPTWHPVRDELRRGVDPAALADMGYPVDADGHLVTVDEAQTTKIVSLLNPMADIGYIDPHTRAIGLQAIHAIREQMQNSVAS